MMHTVLVIALFCGMVLSPCIVATMNTPALMADEDQA